MPSGIVSQSDPRSIVLPAGEIVTIASLDRSSFGNVSIVTADVAASALAQGSIAARASQNFGPFLVDVRVLITPLAGTISYSSKYKPARSQAYASSTPVTPGTNVVPGEGVSVACSAPGNVRLIMADGSFLDIYAQMGVAFIDNIAVIGVDAANTSATVKISVLRQG